MAVDGYCSVCGRLLHIANIVGMTARCPKCGIVQWEWLRPAGMKRPVSKGAGSGRRLDMSEDSRQAAMKLLEQFNACDCANGWNYLADVDGELELDPDRQPTACEECLSAIAAALAAAHAEGRAEGLKALDAVDAYLSTTMWPTSIENACAEGIWDRARRSGLQEARNAIAAEREKAAAPAGVAPEEKTDGK